MSKTLVCIGGHADGQRFAVMNEENTFLHVPYYEHGKRNTASYSREKFAAGAEVVECWLYVGTTAAEALAKLLENYRPRFIGFGGDTWEVATPLTGSYGMNAPARFAFVLIFKRGGLTVAHLDPDGENEYASEAEARAAGKRFAESLGIEVAE